MTEKNLPEVEHRWTIPPSWAWACVDQLGAVVGGGTPKVSDTSNFQSPGIPWITPSDLTGYKTATIGRGARDLSEKGLSSCGATLLQKGAVLFSSRAPIGYCVVADNELSTNQGFKSLVPHAELESHYIRHYLRSAKEYAESRASGSTFLELSGARFKSLSVPIPPTKEQARIAKKIELLQARSSAAREALDAIPPLLEKFRQSVLAAAFRGDLTREWRARNPEVEPASVLLERIRAERRARWIEDAAEKARGRAEARARKAGKDWGAEDEARALERERAKAAEKYVAPEPVDEEGLPGLPEGWCSAALEDLVDPARGIPYGIVKTGDPVPDGVPTVRCGDIKRYVIAELGLKRVDPTVHAAYDRTQLRGGELLIAIRGTVGAVAIAPQSLRGCNISREVAMVPALEHLDSEYLMYFVSSPQGQAAIAANVKGVAQSGINLADLRTLDVPIPPVEEQKAVVAVVDHYLANIAGAESRTRKAGHALADLDQSILAKAFRGELVPQDPNDEPASALLNRIRAEREAAAAEFKARKKAARRPRTKAGKNATRKSGARKRRTTRAKNAT